MNYGHGDSRRLRFIVDSLACSVNGRMRHSRKPLKRVAAHASLVLRLLGATAGFCAVLAGCAGAPAADTLATTTPLIPDATIKLSESTSIPVEKLVFWSGYAAVAYLVLDPLAPNWNIEEAAFPDDRYFMTLRMKRYYAGGAGEARKVFNQRAKALMLRAGFDGYDVIDYSESLESSVLGSQRVVQGVISLTRRQR